MLLPRIRRSRTPPRPPETTSLFFFFLLLTCFSTLSSFAQTISIPSLPSLSTYNVSLTASTPLLLSLNSSSSSTPSTIYVSISLCTESNLLPTIILTNSSTIDVPSSSDLSKKGTTSNPSKGVWILTFDAGFASWNGSVGEGGLRLASYSAADGIVGEIEVGFSSTAPLQTISSTLPVLGDTTFTHLLLFTPVFASPPSSPIPQSYPNYVLPPPSNSLNSSLPTITPNHSLYIFPTSSQLTNASSSYGKSSCFLRRQEGWLKNVTVVEKQTRLLEGKGWREMLVLEGSELTPEGNYTLWVETRVEGVDGVELSGPVEFRMKEADFPCPLLYTSPSSTCPSLTYAAALPQSATGLLTDLPTNLTSIIDAYLASFATTLSTYACGRDNYSPVSSCEMCYEVYREWLCREMVPQCASPSSLLLNQSTTLINPSSPSLSPSLLSPNLTSLPYNYTRLLPCLETCQIVTRICPVFLSFRCPLAKGGRDGLGTARSSYGVGRVGFEGEVGSGEGVGRFGIRGREVERVEGCGIWEGLRG